MQAPRFSRRGRTWKKLKRPPVDPGGRKGRQMVSKVLFSSETDQWATPGKLFDKLNKEFGFDLDPCADENNHKCPKYFTKEVDGLTQNWGGHTVFCNPPYGREIGSWVQKSYEESLKENTKVVMLIPSRTDTKWFHEYVLPHGEIRFIRGRLKFGESKNNAPFPSMVVIFDGRE